MKNKWQLAREDHRCAVVNVDAKDFERHAELVQKFFAQTLVVQAEFNYAFRCYKITVLCPELPPAGDGYRPPTWDLEINLSSYAKPAAYIGGFDRLLKVSL